MIKLHEPNFKNIQGLSSKQASELAQHVCKCAGESGQTLLAYNYLKLLAPIMEHKN